jgi:hypothetical protein
MLHFRHTRTYAHKNMHTLKHTFNGYISVEDHTSHISIRAPITRKKTEGTI